MDNDNRLKIASIFRRNLRPKPDSPNLLMTLAPELRNRIYDLYLQNAKAASKIGPYPRKRYGAWHELDLLQVAKQIRHEVAPTFYKSVSFTINNGLHSAVLARNINKTRFVINLCGLKPFGGVRIIISAGAWEKIGEILPLLELMRETGFDPAMEGYKQNVVTHFGKTAVLASLSSIFMVSSTAYGVLQRVLEQAVALGRKARDEGWSKEMLAAEFATWKKKAKSSRGKNV